MRRFWMTLGMMAALVVVNWAQLLPGTEHRVAHAPHAQGSSWGRSDPMLRPPRASVGVEDRVNPD